MSQVMTSSRPYLLRALHEWIVDNHMTPHIVVDADCEGAVVPRQFVENGKIVFNISPYAVKELHLGDEAVMFSARFGGKAMEVTVPVAGVMAVYARENGQGMVFGEENTPPTPEGPDEGPGGDDGGKEPGSGRPQLKLVK